MYRVEIHKSGIAEGHSGDSDFPTATYKWSRENSSVSFPIVSIQNPIITLEHLGKDCRYGLKPNDWVELIDDVSVLQNRADSLFQVESIDIENRMVILKDAPENISLFDESKHPYLRRWDHAEGGKRGIELVETADGQAWPELEDGILIKFDSAGKTGAGEDDVGKKLPMHDIYRTGDYWLIPARTITGDIEWPRDNEGNAKCVPAHGIIHHYAPLVLFDGGNGNDENGESTDEGRDVDLRRILKQAWE